jgi:hypothetical protein
MNIGHSFESAWFVLQEGITRKDASIIAGAEGVRAGVPDLCLPVARKGYHGLYLELKVGRNTISDLQEQWIDALREQGYFVDVAWGWQAAAQVIADYLGIETGL